MFRKKNSHALLGQSERSYVGETLHIEGDIHCTGALDVAGLIRGNIQGDEMIVLETGFIKGNLNVRKIEINGHIEGEVIADIIDLGRNAVVKGDLLFKSTLRTVEGADIDWYIKKTCASKKNIEEDKDIEEIKTREYGKPVLVQDQDEEIKAV